MNKCDKDDGYMAAARTPLHIAFMSPKRSASSLKVLTREKLEEEEEEGEEEEEEEEEEGGGKRS